MEAWLEGREKRRKWGEMQVEPHGREKKRQLGREKQPWANVKETCMQVFKWTCMHVDGGCKWRHVWREGRREASGDMGRLGMKA